MEPKSPSSNKEIADNANQFAVIEDFLLTLHPQACPQIVVQFTRAFQVSCVQPPNFTSIPLGMSQWKAVDGFLSGRADAREMTFVIKDEHFSLLTQSWMVADPDVDGIRRQLPQLQKMGLLQVKIVRK